jgi:hypothetical protein
MGFFKESLSKRISIDGSGVSTGDSNKNLEMEKSKKSSNQNVNRR